MLRRSWKTVAGASILVGAPSYYYYTQARRQSTFDLAVRVRGPDGKSAIAKRTIPLLNAADVTARITEHASNTRAARPDGFVWHHATAQLNSNDPIEDAHASAIVSRDAALAPSAAAGDLLFFAVMDGHGGYHTSRLLSKILIPAVTLELRSLVDDVPAREPRRLIDRLWSVLPWTSTPTPSRFDADPYYITLALQTAFANVDSELINAPLRLLASAAKSVAASDPGSKAVPDLSQHPMAQAAMSPAMSGSCALLALLDTAHSNLYVANTGDCRAVAGNWDSSAQAWRADVLTDDQTGRNPTELLRMQSEHPPEEAADVIQRGRVLGGLEPTRAFGDARYKWPREIQQLLGKAFGVEMRKAPATLKTPPYVTSRPVVTHRTLALPRQSSAAPANNPTFRFLILATDGLWDQLSSADAVALVGAHLAGVRGTSVPRAALAPTLVTHAGVQGKAQEAYADSVGKGPWAFVDENPGAHLIRNALGGADDKALRRVMSIPAPTARNYRDDITVTVVWWDDGGTSGTETFKARL